MHITLSPRFLNSGMSKRLLTSGATAHFMIWYKLAMHMAHILHLSYMRCFYAELLIYIARYAHVLFAKKLIVVVCRYPSMFLVSVPNHRVPTPMLTSSAQSIRGMCESYNILSPENFRVWRIFLSRDVIMTDVYCFVLAVVTDNACAGTLSSHFILILKIKIPWAWCCLWNGFLKLTLTRFISAEPCLNRSHFCLGGAGEPSLLFEPSYTSRRELSSPVSSACISCIRLDHLIKTCR